jgi:hypothetical protein
MNKYLQEHALAARAGIIFAGWGAPIGAGSTNSGLKMLLA